MKTIKANVWSELPLEFRVQRQPVCLLSGNGGIALFGFPPEHVHHLKKFKTNVYTIFLLLKGWKILWNKNIVT